MSTLKQSVEQQFGSAADAYRTSVVHAQGEDLARLVEEARLTGVERVLDAGCGAGHTAAAVAPHARNVLAIDLSASMLAVTEKLAQDRGLTNVNVRRGDVEALPVGDGEFDVVVSRYSAHHWPHPLRALQEVRRVIKPGGRLVLGDVVSWDEPTLDTWLQALELLRDPSHVRDHSLTQWQGLCAQAGFAMRVAHRFDIWLDFDAWVRRIATPEDNVRVLRALLQGAPVEARTALRVEPSCDFTLQGALIVATPNEAA